MKKSSENGKNSILKLLKDKKAFTVISALFLTALFVAFGISTVNQRADISRLEQQKAEISAKYDEQTKENKELQAVLDSENKDDYIEKKAREKGYVKSDEVVFYDISASE
ncbi:MAG: septum formation initiator family protein [Eubacteriales bacterium]|nr:septum formation initiator family protein [Eubacteriales bacterium]